MSNADTYKSAALPLYALEYTKTNNHHTITGIFQSITFLIARYKNATKQRTALVSPKAPGHYLKRNLKLFHRFY